MSRTVVDINRELLDAGCKALGTTTVEDTVNQALRLVAEDRLRHQLEALQRYPSEPIEGVLAARRARETKIG